MLTLSFFLDIVDNMFIKKSIIYFNYNNTLKEETMKLRKLTALALAASMVTAMLTGCSGSSSSAPAATETVKTEAAAT